MPLFMLPSFYMYLNPGSVTIPNLIITLFLLLWFYKYKKLWKEGDFDRSFFIKLFIVVNSIIYIRGFSNVIIQSDMYNMVTGLLVYCIIFPQLIYLSTPEKTFTIWKSFLSIGALLCLISFFTPIEETTYNVAYNASFLCCFIFCLPYLSKKWTIIILVLSFLMVTYDIECRSNLIGYILPFIIVICYPIFGKRINMKAYYYLMFLMPVILLVLGALGVFNVFTYMAESSDFQIEGADRTVTVDSRTGIFVDVIGGLYNQNAILFGLGGNGRVETHIAQNLDFSEVYKYGRSGTESGMLNYILQAGILGLIAYGGLILRGSYNAIFKSNNDFMKMLGLYMVFKYVFSFIEDRIMLNAHSLYIFLWIGMCYNRTFRNMSNTEFKTYVCNIFNNKMKRYEN